MLKEHASKPDSEAGQKAEAKPDTVRFDTVETEDEPPF